jgi:DNA-directed RNA polymerase specialized sigma24 family protein
MLPLADTPTKFSPACPRAPARCAYLRSRDFASAMRYRRSYLGSDFTPVSTGKTPLEQAVAAQLVSDMNLLRLKAAARFLARGLSPEIYWWDLLQEAFARVLNGSRHCPAGVPFDVFMTGVMRSIRAEHWRRKAVRESSVSLHEIQMRDPAPDPERVILAQQELQAIGELFADDPIVTHIITGLGDGLSADEIRTKYGISTTEYDSARKRLRRALLRDSIRTKIK